MKCVYLSVLGIIILEAICALPDNSEVIKINETVPEVATTSIVSYATGENCQLVAWKEPAIDSVIKISVLNTTPNSLKIVMISSAFSLELTVFDKNGNRVLPVRTSDPPSIPSNAVLTLSPYAAHWGLLKISELEARYGQSMQGCFLNIKYGISESNLAKLKELGVTSVTSGKLSVTLPL